MPLNNFGIVAPRLFRSAQPDIRGLEDLTKFGVRSIIKLNSTEEFSAGIEKENFIGEVFCYSIPNFWPTKDDATIAAKKIQELLNSSRDCTLVHCTHGRDRTGLVIGAWRIIYFGWTFEKVMEEFEQYGAVGLIKLADFHIVGLLKEIAEERCK